MIIIKRNQCLTVGWMSLGSKQPITHPDLLQTFDIMNNITESCVSIELFQDQRAGSHQRQYTCLDICNDQCCPPASELTYVR